MVNDSIDRQRTILAIHTALQQLSDRDCPYLTNLAVQTMIDAYEAAKRENQPAEVRVGEYVFHISDIEKPYYTLPQQPADRVVAVIESLINAFRRSDRGAYIKTAQDRPGWIVIDGTFNIHAVAEAAIAAMPSVEVDHFDVEVAIAEAIALMPADMAYEEKGVPVREYLQKLGYRIVKGEA